MGISVKVLIDEHLKLNKCPGRFIKNKRYSAKVIDINITAGKPEECECLLSYYIINDEDGVERTLGDSEIEEMN